MKQISSLGSSTLRFGALALLGALCSACGVSGSGVIEERTRSLDAFDKIEISDGFEASLVQGDDYSVTVWVDDNIIDDVNIDESGDTVKVDLDLDNTRDATLEVEFTMPELAGVKLEDASSLLASQVVFTDDLDIQVHDASRLHLSAAEDHPLDYISIEARDASNVTMDLMVTEGTVTASDASTIELDGRANMMTIDISDASHFNGRSLQTGNMSFQLTDASNAEINVEGEARGKLRDASHLDVWGGGQVEADTGDSSSVTIKD